MTLLIIILLLLSLFFNDLIFSAMVLIFCIDMLALFQEGRKFRELYRPRDTHWNESGNRLAGTVIYQYLDGRGLIPGAKEAETHAFPQAGTL